MKSTMCLYCNNKVKNYYFFRKHECKIDLMENLDFLEDSKDVESETNIRSANYDELDHCFAALESENITQEKLECGDFGENFLSFENFSPPRAATASISDLERTLLETFSGKSKGAHKNNTIESLRSTLNLHSVEKCSLSEDFMATLTPSDILGVSPNAPYDEIRSAYKEKVRLMHPDKNPNLSVKEQQMFKRMTEAYMSLTKE